MPPAVALASIDEKAAPKKPTTKIVEPTLPASGSKTLASAPSVALLAGLAEDRGGDHDDEAGHDARRDDARDGVGDRRVAVLVGADAALPGGIAGEEGGVDREVGADERDDQQLAARREARDHAGEPAPQSGRARKALAMKPTAISDDHEQERSSTGVDVAHQQDEGDADGADRRPEERRAAEEHREARPEPAALPTEKQRVMKKTLRPATTPPACRGVP